MGLIISTIAFVFSIPKLVKYVKQNNKHNFFEFVTNLIRIKWKKWHTKQRFGLYDFKCVDSFEKMSLLPYKLDYEMELPSKVKGKCFKTNLTFINKKVAIMRRERIKK